MAKRYITQDNLKKNTLADIFIFILNRKQTTRREIEFETGFSWGTVSANVSLLIEKGYVTEEKSDQCGVGRTTYLLKPTSQGIVSIGIDINRSGISCAVIALDSQIVHLFDEKFSAKTQSEVIAQAEAACQAARDWCAAQDLRVFSLGVAMQGTVNGRLGLSVHFPKMEDWQVMDIKSHFAQKYNLPVYLAHDPKCMLQGAMHNKKYEDCVLIRLDDGIGMAVSQDGRILDDTERLELGHTLAVLGGRACACGKKGCLEAYASLEAIALTQNRSAEDVLRVPQEFAEALCQAGELLSVALYNAYILFKPRRMILTGKATALEGLMEQSLSLLREETVDVEIDPDISAAYGAAMEAVKSAVKSFAL